MQSNKSARHPMTVKNILFNAILGLAAFSRQTMASAAFPRAGWGHDAWEPQPLDGHRSQARRLLVTTSAATDIPNAQGQATDNGRVSVLTYRLSLQRNHANIQETLLKPSLVNQATFGLKFKTPVNGSVYAQPLLVSDAPTADGVTHDALFVATMNNYVYKIDALNGSIVASNQLGRGVPATSFPGYNDIRGNIGALGTGHIDPVNKTWYLVAESFGDNNIMRHQIHALDLATLQDKPPFPVTVSGSVPGVGLPNTGNGHVYFNSTQHLQRPALVYDRNRLHIAFGSHGDQTPYHGWILSYHAATGAPMGVFCTTPDDCGGSFWASGNGLAADATGDLWAASANGYIGPQCGGIQDNTIYGVTNRAETLLRFRPSDTGLEVLGTYQPAMRHEDEITDNDFSSCGPVLPPNSSLVLVGDKNGFMHTVARDALTNNQSAPLTQVFKADNSAQFGPGLNSNLHGSPVVWNNRMYIWGENDYGYAFAQEGTGPLFNPTPELATPFHAYNQENSMPGGILAISSNGQQDGILWANLVESGNAAFWTQPGTLHAFNAQNMVHLWSSRDNSSRDSYDNFAKYNPPVVANGMVYLGTFSDQVVAYGLLGLG